MNIFEIKMQENDAGAATVGEYFLKLLVNLWDQGEGFSSKRPFGNSGWQHEVIATLGKAGILDVSFDEGGYLDWYDNGSYDTVLDLLSKSHLVLDEDTKDP